MLVQLIEIDVLPNETTRVLHCTGEGLFSYNSHTHTYIEEMKMNIVSKKKNAHMNGFLMAFSSCQ
jgi:hypothetical protein